MLTLEGYIIVVPELNYNVDVVEGTDPNDEAESRET